MMLERIWRTSREKRELHLALEREQVERHRRDLMRSRFWCWCEQFHPEIIEKFKKEDIGIGVSTTRRSRKLGR